MNILVTGVTEPVELTASWRRKHDVAFASLDGLISGIRESPQTGQRADVIVTSVAHRIEYTGDTFEFVESPLEFVVRVAQDLRKLPSNVAMTDGRKWNSLPFIAVLSAALIDTQIPQSLDISVLMERPRPELTLTEIERIFQEYRERLLDELDNLGLLVSYDHGRYRVGPALTPRERQAEGAFYYGPADQSGSRVGKYYTVDRDVYGIQYEVEKFEALINTPKVSERQLQEFFVEHPHFLVATRLLQALPHVPLKVSS